MSGHQIIFASTGIDRFAMESMATEGREWGILARSEFVTGLARGNTFAVDAGHDARSRNLLLSVPLCRAEESLVQFDSYLPC